MPKSRNRPRRTSRQRKLLAQKLAQGLRKRGWPVRISGSIRRMVGLPPGSRQWRRYCGRMQARFRRESSVLARAARILDKPLTAVDIQRAASELESNPSLTWTAPSPPVE